MSAYDQLIRPRRGRQKTGTFSISDRLVCVRLGPLVVDESYTSVRAV